MMRSVPAIRLRHAAAALLLLPALGYAAPERIEFSEAGDFSELAITRGVKASREQCDKDSYEPWAHLRKEIVRRARPGLNG